MGWEMGECVLHSSSPRHGLLPCAHSWAWMPQGSCCRNTCSRKGHWKWVPGNKSVPKDG